MSILCAPLASNNDAFMCLSAKYEMHYSLSADNIIISGTSQEYLRNLM